MKKIILATLVSLTLLSCGPDPCECVEQFKYWEQDGGLLKLNHELSEDCVKKYKDSDKNAYPFDYESAKKNAIKSCN